MVAGLFACADQVQDPVAAQCLLVVLDPHGGLVKQSVHGHQ